jgi:hypothetical protein
MSETGDFMKTSTLTALIFFALSSIVSAWPSQVTAGPVTKQEILSRLRDVEAHHLSQADIVGEIDQRGIDFTPDEKFLGELRNLGARSFLLGALERAGKNSGKPQISDPEVRKQEAQPENREAMIARLPLIEQARQHALDFAEELPNFIVTQNVTRYSQTPGDKDWKLEDRLEIELTYRVGKGEDFNLLRVDGKPAKQSYGEIGGATSTGEFGSAIAVLFSLESKAAFKEVKHETFRSRPTVVYDFEVKRVNSLYTLQDGITGKKVIVGSTGSIWVDIESRRVLRFEASSDAIPAGFTITLSENAIEYDWITIAGERYLLPVHAELLLGSAAKKIYTKNVIEFRNYRRFEARIKMDPNQ